MKKIGLSQGSLKLRTFKVWSKLVRMDKCKYGQKKNEKCSFSGKVINCFQVIQSFLVIFFIKMFTLAQFCLNLCYTPQNEIITKSLGVTVIQVWSLYNKGRSVNIGLLSNDSCDNCRVIFFFRSFCFKTIEYFQRKNLMLVFIGHLVFQVTW